MKSSMLPALAFSATLITALPNAVHAAISRQSHALLTSRIGSRSEAPATSGDAAGIDWTDKTGANNIYAVTGKFIIPNLQWRPNGPETQLVPISVTINGGNCATGQYSLVAGILGQVYSDGSTAWSATSEWAGYSNANYLTNFAVQPGDSVTFQVVLNNATSGTANFANTSENEKVSVALSGPALCSSDASWLVEDLGEGTDENNTGLADFGAFYMVNALAIADGKYLNASDGAIITMVQDGEDVVKVGASGSNLLFEYTGPK